MPFLLAIADLTHPLSNNRSSIGMIGCYLFWTSGLRTYQPGSHRSKRKVIHDFSIFLLRCLPSFFLREGFTRSFPSSTVKLSFVYQRFNRSPFAGHLFFVRKNPKFCDDTEIRTEIRTGLLPNFFVFVFFPVQQTTSGIGHNPPCKKVFFFGLTTNTTLNVRNNQCNILSYVLAYRAFCSCCVLVFLYGD